MKLALLTIALSLPMAAQAPAPPTPANAPRLNVIFHGLFAFIISSRDIEVLAPQVDDHVYKAGAWGNEMRLKEGFEYELEGVRPASAVPPIDPNANIIVHTAPGFKRDKSKLFCSIKFPLPDQIVGLRRVTVDPRTMFNGKAATQLKCTKIPLVLVFTYALDPNKPLSLGKGLPWQPTRNAVKTVNLHVWAESEALQSPLTMTHPMLPFTQLVGLFPWLDLKMISSATADPDPQTNVRGLDPFEERTLKERSVLLTAIPPPGAPPAAPSAGGSEVTSCIPLIIRTDAQ